MARWSDERLAALRRLMNLSLSYDEIGAELGCTPNAARCTAYKYGWSGHGRSGLIRGERQKGKKRSPETVAKMSAHARRRWQDPKFRAKMVAGIASAAACAARNAKISEAYAQRRGFRIPPEKLTEYRFLIHSKKFTAREAGEVLGLVAPAVVAA
ncbi:MULTISPECIES: hypothetical protein [unclassified Aurantimonas]|uniref:hypothetical protein n=1 Tax=unclassified Aurantimonas TaxID=2638230 RepID=UPI002E19F241|nr:MULTISPECIES: hypothetical protein [unclassified Aurantimonas]MEC5289415.1 hypothetical protein [Aurantimonas sp. C2-3-R2]MEC5410495.1 hypothetical protein [Aurantimonas sp. C2-4-R8]